RCRGWRTGTDERCQAGRRLERRQPLSNVDRGAQLTIDAIDPGVEPPDFGDDFVTQRIDPCDDTVVEPVDLLVQSGDLHGEARVHAIDLRAQTRVDAGDLLVDADDPLIQDANVATDRAELGRDDVLERRFDLIVNAHGLHSSRPSLIGQCLIWNTRGAPATKPLAWPNSTPPATTSGDSFVRSGTFASQPLAVSGRVPGLSV